VFDSICPQRDDIKHRSIAFFAHFVNVNRRQIIKDGSEK
jgi:hypothetical protein